MYEVGSHLSQKEVVTESEVQVSPLLLRALEILDLEKGCNSSSIELCFSSPFRPSRYVILWTEETGNQTADGLFFFFFLKPVSVLS